MLTLTILAAAAAPLVASPPQSAPPSTAPITVHPKVTSQTPAAATVEVPSDDSDGGHWASIWPSDAYKEHIGGRVVLTCDVDRFGVAEWCRVASVKPSGKGFGAAALEMRPLLKLKPPSAGADASGSAEMNIAINFKPPQLDVDFGADRGGGPTGGAMAAAAPQLTMFGSPLPDKEPITLLNNPVWATAASAADVARAYPARGDALDGYAVAHCQVDHQGRLSGCQIIKAAPEDHGFGRAALALTHRFRVAPQWAVAPRRGQLWVDVPIRFPPGPPAARAIDSPYWIAGFDPAQALKVFPPEAAAKGLSSGRGVVRCTVQAGGGLSDCHRQESDPPGLGFGIAAAKLASTLRMNPWSADGGPVDGASVLVTIRLNLGAQP